MKDENFTSQAQEKIRSGNFKAMYNKKYSDITTLSKNRIMTPEQLFDLAVKYFSWAESQAIKAIETASFQGVVTENLVHKPRVFTLTGFCLYCGVTHSAIEKWRKSEGYDEVIAFIDSVIREQKYQLAASGIVNPGMISKELGIDKPQEITISNNSSANDVGTMKEALESVISKL
ncbi:terminase small subunit [Escherichia phage TR2]|nr:terminase small subunit [Escherichia phage TR2]